MGQLVSVLSGRTDEDAVRVIKEFRKKEMNRRAIENQRRKEEDARRAQENKRRDEWNAKYAAGTDLPFRRGMDRFGFDRLDRFDRFDRRTERPGYDYYRRRRRYGFGSKDSRLDRAYSRRKKSPVSPPSVSISPSRGSVSPVRSIVQPSPTRMQPLLERIRAVLKSLTDDGVTQLPTAPKTIKLKTSQVRQIARQKYSRWIVDPTTLSIHKLTHMTTHRELDKDAKNATRLAVDTFVPDGPATSYEAAVLKNSKKFFLVVSPELLKWLERQQEITRPQSPIRVKQSAKKETSPRSTSKKNSNSAVSLLDNSI